jgi:hypothetical protein
LNAQPEKLPALTDGNEEYGLFRQSIPGRRAFKEEEIAGFLLRGQISIIDNLFSIAVRSPGHEQKHPA